MPRRGVSRFERRQIPTIFFFHPLLAPRFGYGRAAAARVVAGRSEADDRFIPRGLISATPHEWSKYRDLSHDEAK